MVFDLKSQRSKIFLLSLILISISVFFFRGSINLFPSFIHAWTQSDRYALVFGFLNNGFDFFHPQTFNLATIDGITRVDFPIHEYIVALIMKLTGIHEAVIFRIYTLIYALTGLVFLFRLSQLFNTSFLRNALAVLFIFFCPVFLYYANGFIPSIPSLSNLFIGYFFYFRYKRDKSVADFRLAIFFLTLAALARLPFFIFLFAVFCQQCLGYFINWYDPQGKLRRLNTASSYGELTQPLVRRSPRGGGLNKKSIRKELIAFGISFTAIGSYQLYNSWLEKKYGTQFLVSFLPPSNSQQLREWLLETWTHWKFDYFTGPQYLIIAVLMTVSLIQLYKERASIIRFKDVFLQLAIAGAGSILFFFLMLMQFPDHDYYFIDAFYPLVALFMIYLMGYSIKNKMLNYALSLILLALIFKSFVRGNETYRKRFETGPWDRVEISRINFKDSGKFLDSIGVAKNAKVLVLDGYTTNVPLLLMNRMGWTVNWTTREKIEDGMSKPFDLVAIQNSFIASEVVKNDPAIITRLEKYADNGFISFYHKKENQDQNLYRFLGIDTLNTLLTISKNDSVSIDDKTEFFELLSDTSATLKIDKPVKILVTGKILRNSTAPQLVASVGTPVSSSSYYSFDLNDYTLGSGKWENILFQFVIQVQSGSSGSVKIYFLNNQKGSFNLGDVHVVCYR